MVKIIYKILFILAIVVGTVVIDIIVGIIFGINPTSMWKAIPSLLSLIIAFILWLASVFMFVHFYSEAKKS